MFVAHYDYGGGWWAESVPSPPSSPGCLQTTELLVGSMAGKTGQHTHINYISLSRVKEINHPQKYVSYTLSIQIGAKGKEKPTCSVSVRCSSISSSSFSAPMCGVYWMGEHYSSN